MSLKTDAIILAEWILDDWWRNDWSDYGTGEYECNYCSAKGGSTDTPKSMKHDLDCPVLVALDIMTK